MSSNTLLLFVLLTLLMSALTVLSHPSPVSGNAPAPGDGESSTEFIRTNCNVTLYPDLCFTSLARYSIIIQNDPLKLARVAASVSLARVRSVSAHVSVLCRGSAAADGGGGIDGREAAALRDCVEALGDARDLTRQSEAEIERLETAEGAEVAWRVGNAQTWMSAALTNEDTCVDGFDSVAAGSVKSDVCGQVRRVSEYTSNALALVNRLVESR